MRTPLVIALAFSVAGAASARKPHPHAAKQQPPPPTVLPPDVKTAITERYSIPPAKTNEVLDALAPRCHAADLDGNGVDEWVIPLGPQPDKSCYTMVLGKDAAGAWSEKWNTACCDLTVVEGVKPSKRGPGHPAMLVCSDGGKVRPIFAWTGAWPKVTTAPLWSDVTANVEAAQKLVAEGHAPEAKRLTCTNRPMLGAPRPDVESACAAALVSLGDLDGAARALDVAASVEPDYPSIALYRGVIAEAKKDAPGAIAQYDKFLAGKETAITPTVKKHVEALQAAAAGKGKWPPPLIRNTTAPAATQQKPAAPQQTPAAPHK